MLIGKIRPAAVGKWQAGLNGGPSYYNAHLWFIRAVFDHAVENRLLHENPAANINAQRRAKPIRSTPSRQQFEQIVKSIRSERLNAKRKDSADLIAFFGEDVIRRLLDGVRPGWESDLRTVRDRHLSLVANGTDPSRLQPCG